MLIYVLPIFFYILLCAEACPIYLTISLTGKTIQDSNLEVNWGPECHERPQWIGIFTADPSVTNTHPEARITNINETMGKIVTDVKIGKLRFPKGWNRNDDYKTPPPAYPKGKCLSYYVASFNDNELLSVECLKIQPNWMSKLSYIAQVPIKDLFIPGTHASGSYILNYGKTKSVLVKDYVAAQHFDVWQQLVFGIRYLDLNLGFKPVDKYDTNNPDNFWVVNENMFVNKLRDILKDVKRFVKMSQEIVIMDFSAFPIGFYKHPERHSDLLHLLHEEVGDIAYTRSSTTSNEMVPCYQLTMDDIRKTDKYLIILYPVEELPYPENESQMLCATWKRFSTGFMNASQALDYMRLLFSKKDSSPVQDEGWVFNAIKSMEQSLNNNKLQTAKERAAALNPKITSWLRGPWSMTANVVAMDYFSNTNIIDVAIYANLHKAFNMANKNLINFEILSS